MDWKKFSQLLSLAKKESHYRFDNTLYKQIDGVVMGSQLGISLANIFFDLSWTKLATKIPFGIKSIILSTACRW